MAPEVYFNNSTKPLVYTDKCDIWSLGVILFEMIYNENPFHFDIKNFLT